jgi:hypothetical protein
MQKPWVKTMLTAVCYAKGVIHHKIVPDKQCVNGKCYKEAINRVIPLADHVTTVLLECGSWYHLEDSALVHSLGTVSEFLAKQGLCEEWCLLGCYAVWRNNPEDTILHSHRRENLKSYKGSVFSQPF